MSTLPLKNRCIVVTRPEAQSVGFKKALEAAGAEVVLFPTIEIRDVTDPVAQNALARAVADLATYRWLLLTSVNSVERFVKACKKAGVMPALKIGAIGEETARTAQAAGLKVDLYPEDFRGEGFLQALRAADERSLMNGARVLLPRALEAREVLPEGLRALGAVVDVIPVYETVASSALTQPLMDLWQKQAIDVLTFTSPSTVNFFFEKLKSYDTQPLIHDVKWASIGPVTAAALESRGIRPEITANPYTAESLAKAIVEHYLKESSDAG